MGRKPGACKGLDYLVQKGIDVVAVVTLPKSSHSIYTDRLADTASNYGIPIASVDDVYRYLNESQCKDKAYYGFSLENIDLVISYLFLKRIKKPLIDLPRIGCINFHPAPLPDFKGVFGYNFAIYENLHSWGVSAHYVDEGFDAGDIIKVFRFDIDPKKETTFSLEQKAQQFLYHLFESVIDEVCETGTLPRYPNEGVRYIRASDFEELRRIKLSDSHDEIDRKIRASWYPPYAGAFIEINGKKYTVINEQILEDIGQKYHKSQNKR